MKSNFSCLIVFLVINFLTGCCGQSFINTGCTRDESRVLIGTVPGTLSGPCTSPIVGNGIGRMVDPLDYPEAREGFEDATRVVLGKKVYWQSSLTGHWGSFCPISDCHSPRGEYCREFLTSAYIDGKLTNSRGKACRRCDGTWYQC